MSECKSMIDGKCTHPIALPLYGERPSKGICQVCVHYEGPPRPEPTRKNLVQKAASYVKAEVSLVTHGSVGDTEYNQRISICLACPRLAKSTEAGQIGWCGACGCGRGPRAELTVKARMPQAKCPVNAWPNRDTPNR